MFSSEKVWQIVCGLSSQFIAYHSYPYGQNLSICQAFLPTTFNVAIHQTLALSNIPAIQ